MPLRFQMQATIYGALEILDYLLFQVRQVCDARSNASLFDSAGRTEPKGQANAKPAARAQRRVREQVRKTRLPRCRTNQRNRGSFLRSERSRDQRQTAEQGALASGIITEQQGQRTQLNVNPVHKRPKILKLD